MRCRKTDTPLCFHVPEVSLRIVILSAMSASRSHIAIHQHAQAHLMNLHALAFKVDNAALRPAIVGYPLRHALTV